jgi:adenylate kinase family enzyme
MKEKTPISKKILIVGDASRGKSTLAEKISKKLGIPFYSTDDFYWKTKFTESNDRQKSLEEINKIYNKDEWIVDGSTGRLIHDGLEQADVIYLLEFTHIIPQYYSLITRHLKRKNETIAGIWELLKHVTKKRYKKGYASHKPLLKDMLKPYKNKVVRLTSFKEIDKFINNL